jgi:hypothetical protein
MKKNTDATWEEVRKITESPAFNRVGAKVIINPAGDLCGTIKILYPKDGAGVLKVVLHEHGYSPQIGKACGYGYDKLSAALQGLVFGQSLPTPIILADHPVEWETQLRNAGYKVYGVV